MASITSLGIGSGLDISDIVAKLVEAEKAPTQARIQRQRDDIQAKLSAFGQIKSDLANLRDAVKNLKSPIFWQRRQAVSSADQVLTATAGSVAREGSYQIQVNRIAQSHALATGGFASVDEVVGTGTLTIRFGTWTYDGSGNPQSFAADPQAASQTLTIDASNNTLSGIRDAINRAGIGVRASIVNDGSGYRLVVSSSETGQNRALEISVSDGDGNATDNSGLSRLAFNTSALNLTETRKGQDAELIVDGLTVTSASNLVSGVIDGVTLNLKSASSTLVNLNVGIDEKAITEALQKFVDSYNQLKGHVAELTAFNLEDGKPNGVLLGDGTVRAVDNQLKRMLGQVVQGLENAGVRSLADVGLSFDRHSGKLNLDQDKFQALVESQPEALKALFASQGTTTDSQVQYFGATSKTQAGTYAIEITQLATQGSYAGASELDFSTPLVVDADNDEFTLEVDGVRSGAIRLTQGSYASGVELAQEIEQKINADAVLKAAGRHVEVSYDADNNRFTLTSSTYGSSSQVAFVQVDTNTASSLGFSVGSGTQGQDVAGKINGVEATGRGQFLTGAVGDASEGLQIKITGGATGARGSITLVRGVADQLDGLIQKLTESQGPLGGKLEGLNKQLAKLAEQESRLNARMEQLESFYLKKFNAMDQLVAKLKQTSESLAQQLKALQPQTEDK